MTSRSEKSRKLLIHNGKKSEIRFPFSAQKSATYERGLLIFLFVYGRKTRLKMVYRQKGGCTLTNTYQVMKAIGRFTEKRGALGKAPRGKWFVRSRYKTGCNPPSQAHGTKRTPDNTNAGVTSGHYYVPNTALFKQAFVVGLVVNSPPPPSFRQNHREW